MEYTFEDWLKGKPEPEGLEWIYTKETVDNPPRKNNPVYLQVSKAKKETFDKALEMSLHSAKNQFLKKIQNLTDFKLTEYIKQSTENSEKHFKEFDSIKLIEQSHSQKYKGIDGKKYLQVKEGFKYWEENNDTLHAHNLNSFFFGLIHFELSIFYNECLTNPNQKEELNKHQKAESLSVKFKLLNHFFTEKTEFNSIQIKDQNALLGLILGCRADTAKNIRNRAFKANPDGKHITQNALDRFAELLVKIKNGETY